MYFKKKSLLKRYTVFEQYKPDDCAVIRMMHNVLDQQGSYKGSYKDYIYYVVVFFAFLFFLNSLSKLFLK